MGDSLLIEGQDVCKPEFVSGYHPDVFVGLCSRGFCKAGDTVSLRASLASRPACWSLVCSGISILILVWVTPCLLCSDWKPVLLGLASILPFRSHLHRGADAFSACLAPESIGISILYFTWHRGQTSRCAVCTPWSPWLPSSSHSSFLNGQLIWFVLSCACIRVMNEIAYEAYFCVLHILNFCLTDICE